MYCFIQPCSKFVIRRVHMARRFRRLHQKRPIALPMPPASPLLHQGIGIRSAIKVPMYRSFALLLAADRAARLKSFITIQRTEPPGEIGLIGTTRVSFQGLPAYGRMAIDRESTFDDPALSSYHLYVDAAGEWWLIGWVVADAIRELPPEIKKYIDTVRLPAAATSSEPAHEPEPAAGPGSSRKSSPGAPAWRRGFRVVCHCLEQAVPWRA